MLAGAERDRHWLYLHKISLMLQALMSGTARPDDALKSLFWIVRLI